MTRYQWDARARLERRRLAIVFSCREAFAIGAGRPMAILPAAGGNTPLAKLTFMGWNERAARIRSSPHARRYGAISAP